MHDVVAGIFFVFLYDTFKDKDLPRYSLDPLGIWANAWGRGSSGDRAVISTNHQLYDYRSPEQSTPLWRRSGKQSKRKQDKKADKEVRLALLSARQNRPTHP